MVEKFFMLSPNATMKKIFPGYFEPTSAEFDDMWRTGVVVLDANILLHLFRYGRETRKEVLNTLRALTPRVWVPYQVAYEFAKNWRSVDSTNRSIYSKLKDDINSKNRSLISIFESVKKYQIIDFEKQKEKIELFIKDLCDSVDQAEKAHPTIDEAKETLDSIHDLIGESVGSAPSEDKIKQMISEGERRYVAKVPPGYMDMVKEGDDKYGDYFIWEEMVSESSKRNVPVIFICDDRKEDWMLRHDGKDIGPRPELVQEFFKRTGQKFYCYSFRVFLERAKQYTNVEVTAKAIAEVEENQRNIWLNDREAQIRIFPVEKSFGLQWREYLEARGLTEESCTAADFEDFERLQIQKPVTTHSRTLEREERSLGNDIQENYPKYLRDWSLDQARIARLVETSKNSHISPEMFEQARKLDALRKTELTGRILSDPQIMKAINAVSHSIHAQELYKLRNEQERHFLDRVRSEKGDDGPNYGAADIETEE